MALDRTRRSEPTSAFSATLPLRALARFSSMELLIAVNEQMKDAGVEAMLVPELTAIEEAPENARVWNRPKAPPKIGLNINGEIILVEGHDRQAFNSGEQARLDFRSWPQGRERVARGRAHVEITEAAAPRGSDIDHNYDRAVAVTAVSAAVAALTEAVGIVWCPSHCVAPAEQLAPLMAALVQGQPPVSLWVGCPSQSAGQSAGAQGAFTRGLYPLLGMEIEVEVRDLPAAVAFDIARGLVEEALRSGEPPEDGARLKYNRTTEFGVRYRMNGIPGAVPAVVLSQIAEPAQVKVTAGAA